MVATPLVQRLLLHLQHLHRDAGVQEVHGDAATHGAGADDGHGLDVALGRVVGHVRNLAGGALGQEQVAQRTALGREHQRGEQSRARHHAVVKLLRLVAASTASTHLAGAGKFLDMP
jgi:hypothetical protein